jgi:hypothetical protein
LRGRGESITAITIYVLPRACGSRRQMPLATPLRFACVHRRIEVIGR